MFTGLIESVGTVLKVATTRGTVQLTVAAPAFAGRWKEGDSIAVNGVCLTAIDINDADDPAPGRFCADLAQETVNRTTLARLQPGDLVNLELPTPSGSPLGGHVVQGHVDTTGKLLSLIPLHPTDLDNTDWRLILEVPHSLSASIIPQGSITIDGISLTIAKIDRDDPTSLRVEIAIIPHTYKSTNLHALLSGTPVNLETDALSKYAALHIAELATPPTLTTPSQVHTITPIPPPETPIITTKNTTNSEWLTPEYLIANGY